MASKSFFTLLYRLILAITTWGMAGSLAALAQDSTGLKSSVAVDAVGEFNIDKDEKPVSDQLFIREAEFALFGPIDHTFDGMLSVAAHQEDGVHFLEVHEAFIGSTKLIPRSRFRLGKFFLGIGRLNQIHRHDWPFVSAPEVHRTFFDQEAVDDSGLEYSILLPLPFYLDLTIGVTNGWTFGHTHVEGEKPRQPNQYARLATFTSLPGNGGLQVGLNALKRMPEDKSDHMIAGVDIVAKWRESKTVKLLVQSEIWQRTSKPQGEDAEKSLGSYLYTEYGVNGQLGVGIRWDYFTVTTLEDAADDEVENDIQALVHTVTYRNSEFAVFRLAYNHRAEKSGSETKETPFMEIQSTFILGAHPAHDF